MNSMLNRRHALKLLAGGAIAAAPALHLVNEASAGRTWCRADPLFSIGGYLFDVAISSDTQMLTTATGPVQITLTVPFGLPVETIYQDDGFGYGYDITINDSKNFEVKNKSLDLRVKIVAPATDKKLPVQLTVSSYDKKCSVSQSVVAGYSNNRIVWIGKIDRFLWTGDTQVASDLLTS